MAVTNDGAACLLNTASAMGGIAAPRGGGDCMRRMAASSESLQTSTQVLAGVRRVKLPAANYDRECSILHQRININMRREEIEKAEAAEGEWLRLTSNAPMSTMLPLAPLGPSTNTVPAPPLTTRAAPNPAPLRWVPTLRPSQQSPPSLRCGRRRTAATALALHPPQLPL